MLYCDLRRSSRFRTALEDLNCANTVAGCPDAGSIDVPNPERSVAKADDLLQWIGKRSTMYRTSSGGLFERVPSGREIGVTEVVVFGSQARDDYRPESDVNALVVSPGFEENEATNGRNRSTERRTTGGSRTRN